MRGARDTTFETACGLLEAVLSGSRRQEIVGELGRAPTLGSALGRLRDAVCANVVGFGADRIDLAPAINALDRVTEREGFHVLHDWDGQSDRVNDTTIPVDVLDYVVRLRGDEAANPTVIAILLDYYLVHLVELCALRAWDEGDADANLDRLTRLLGELQGAGGSGQPFAADADTLILLATSHFELHERGYARLLERVKSLSPRHQTAIAMGHAASIGSHLRFGFEASYGRDTVVMRDDNVADYPWLCFALVTLMREYSRMHDERIAGEPRERVVEAILNGLSADARAFVGPPPAILSSCERDRAEVAERFRAHQIEIVDAFERFRPSEHAYSPLSLFFNFSHNVRKGTVVDALLRGELWPLAFNDLLTGVPPDDPKAPLKETLANTLMTYARLNPDRIRGRLMPVIVYDPQAGRQAFGITMRRLRE